MKLRKSLIILIILAAVFPAFAAGEDLPSVEIRMYHSEPFSMARPETDILWGPHEGEFLELTIKGEIRNFRHSIGKFDWESEEIKDEVTINHLYRVKDSVIVISTFLPVGIPVEKLDWSDLDGNQYEFIIKAGSDGTDEWTILPEKR